MTSIEPSSPTSTKNYTNADASSAVSPPVSSTPYDDERDDVQRGNSHSEVKSYRGRRSVRRKSTTNVCFNAPHYPPIDLKTRQMWVIALLDALTLSSASSSIDNDTLPTTNEEPKKGSSQRDNVTTMKECLQAARAIEQTMYEHPAEQYNETMQLCLAVIRLSTREKDPNGKPFGSFQPELWWPNSIVHYLRYTSTQTLRRMLACENEWEHSILDQWNWERDILNQEISLEEEEITDEAEEEKDVSEQQDKKKQHSSSFVSTDIDRQETFSSTHFDSLVSRKKNVGERHCVCGSRRIVTSTHQMRKADEGATTVFRCVECNRTWRKNA